MLERQVTEQGTLAASRIAKDDEALVSPHRLVKLDGLAGRRSFSCCRMFKAMEQLILAIFGLLGGERIFTRLQLELGEFLIHQTAIDGTWRNLELRPERDIDVLESDLDLTLGLEDSTRIDIEISPDQPLEIVALRARSGS